MNDGHKNDIKYLIAKFSALSCPSNTRCTKCVCVQTVHDAYHCLGLRMASCDKCEQTLYEAEVVLHCPPNHRHHNEGYDLCVKCGEIILKKQQRQQQSILRQVTKHKKRKIAQINNNNNNTDNKQQTPPKKKRKRGRGRPRKYPLLIQNKKPIQMHYTDWEKQIMQQHFIDNYISYLRTAPNLCDNAIKIINRYSSWLDFVRLNEGSEMNILNILCEFGRIVSFDSVSMMNTSSIDQLNDLSEYLTSSDIDYKHIWNNAAMNDTQIDEHDAIAKYASNYMAHNSLHKTLFGNRSNDDETIRWKQISQMIEQSHFIRDWKLNIIDCIIQKQIDVLQSLISQHSTLNNNLATNCKVITPSDLKINIWKRHILKLRNIRMKPNVGLEFPMNVLNYDRTEIDHIAKIAAINGIQYITNDNASKAPLPYSKGLLTLRDLLPNKYTSNNDINQFIYNIPQLIGDDDDSSSIEIVRVKYNESIDLTNEMDISNVNQVYSDKQYWQKFHNQQKMNYFEWFCNYDDISSILDKYIVNKRGKILEIGCGLSSMASRMVLQNGYRDILCLDWCCSAINKIKNILDKEYGDGSKEKQLLNECINYTVQDIRSMTFQRRTFDVVIDKGTLDAIDCGVSLESHLDSQAKLDGSGRDNLADNFEEIVAICSRIHEILKPNGLFIIVTSRSIVKRIEFVDELKTCHKRHFQKLYAENIKTELKDWRDGDSKTPKLIILKADKNSRKHKHKKIQST